MPLILYFLPSPTNSAAFVTSIGSMNTREPISF